MTGCASSPPTRTATSTSCATSTVAQRSEGAVGIGGWLGPGVFVRSKCCPPASDDPRSPTPHARSRRGRVRCSTAAEEGWSGATRAVPLLWATLAHPPFVPPPAPAAATTTTSREGRGRATVAAERDGVVVAGAGPLWVGGGGGGRSGGPAPRNASPARPPLARSRSANRARAAAAAPHADATAAARAAAARGGGGRLAKNAAAKNACRRLEKGRGPRAAAAAYPDPPHARRVQATPTLQPPHTLRPFRRPW